MKKYSKLYLLLFKEKKNPLISYESHIICERPSIAIFEGIQDKGVKLIQAQRPNTA